MKHIKSLLGYKESMLLKRLDFDVDKTEQYSAVRLVMVTILNIDSGKISRFEINFLGTDHVIKTNQPNEVGW